MLVRTIFRNEALPSGRGSLFRTAKLIQICQPTKFPPNFLTFSEMYSQNSTSIHFYGGIIEHSLHFYGGINKRLLHFYGGMNKHSLHFYVGMSEGIGRFYSLTERDLPLIDLRFMTVLPSLVMVTTIFPPARSMSMSNEPAPKALTLRSAM